jgi:hypothetical protein
LDISRPEVLGLFVANIKITPEEEARAKAEARFLKYAKKSIRKMRKNAPKSKSIRAVSGGLPTLGKRR